MTEEQTGVPTVLVVEDETELADLYADYLRETYDVDVAYSGEEAIEMLSDEYDAVLLDRRMPVVSGNEVVVAIEDQNIQCRVAMVTAVNPDFDIIDLGIDDYLVKPVTRQEVIDTVDRLLTISEYNERAQELTAKKLKRNVLEVEKTRAELQESEEFERLTAEIAELEETVETIADELDAENLERYI
ncbi:response regulator [Salinibaculum salinum]|uniref:response regulator n=1 Tax=Salinibaculum salinum TaxID=3131996 RepID=UPI0030EE54CD